MKGPGGKEKKKKRKRKTAIHKTRKQLLPGASDLVLVLLNLWTVDLLTTSYCYPLLRNFSLPNTMYVVCRCSLVSVVIIARLTPDRI
ncbi:hypothetical protein BO82DRAFT_358441 [Aspergillus uvarum CBS 121591]|uniref:Uncharacterized protein n=1 Tax=Aspergillus uvarum CBS 121591 TaxID=1448315 RepID=A0A319CF66_9EURO|nr:hypothetical protein BO82DRAFT_358441 [Aspergillus uvarum CBS 121591]PYH77183.1 hypothetical protein BO82DRAFT_358441 [Aspergillus uvarum CBS 121591]